MIRQYETTFVIDAHLSNDEIETSVSKYSQLIEKNKGNVKLVDRWGKRRLAYEIAKKQYGYYVYIRFEAEGAVVGALEREFKLDDLILRYLVLRVPTSMIKEELGRAAALQTDNVQDEEIAESDDHDDSDAPRPDADIHEESEPDDDVSDDDREKDEYDAKETNA